MQFVSVLLMGLLAATAVLAGPGPAPARAEGDAEVVGRGTKSEGSEGSEGGIRTGDGVYAYIPGLRDFGSLRNFFNRIFGLGRRDETQGTNEGDSSEGGASHGGESDSSNRESARGLLGFGDLFGFNSFIPVFRAKKYNVTYTNSSLEVVKYGGVPMVVNRTIEERKAEDGSVYFSVVSTLVGPYNSTEVDETDGGYTTEVSPATEDDLELVKEQPSTKLKHTSPNAGSSHGCETSWRNGKTAKRRPRERPDSHNDGNTNTLEKEKEEKERRSDPQDVKSEPQAYGGGWSCRAERRAPREGGGGQRLSSVGLYGINECADLLAVSRPTTSNNVTYKLFWSYWSSGFELGSPTVDTKIRWLSEVTRTFHLDRNLAEVKMAAVTSRFVYISRRRADIVDTVTRGELLSLFL
ncbi:uncharacterized protein LOC126997248 [Eriocheir sinensis]|uniref:uncharacterized protein LOC126997248 n=1 Tax=Eriocheir sinensis TaxID=95602 RepID=UPI0021C62897|nr:uncharacterized protein LOC126997248 [Eriocheir sinensis]